LLVGLLLRRTLRDTKEIFPMDEMLDPEMARLRAMRVADLIDGLVGLDREPFEWEQYKKVLREKMAAAGAAKLSDLMRIRI
jgi:hypothetical protein